MRFLRCFSQYSSSTVSIVVVPSESLVGFVIKHINGTFPGQAHFYTRLHTFNTHFMFVRCPR